MVLHRQPFLYTALVLLIGGSLVAARSVYSSAHGSVDPAVSEPIEPHSRGRQPEGVVAGAWSGIQLVAPESAEPVGGEARRPAALAKLEVEEPPRATPARGVDAAQDPDTLLEAASGNLVWLLELGKDWSQTAEEAKTGARAAFLQILELDEDNEVAHLGLGHHAYDGKWFESYAKLSVYRRAQAKVRLQESSKPVVIWTSACYPVVNHE